MDKSFTFNGIRKPYIKILRGINRPPFAPIRRNIIRIPNRAGGILSSSETDVLYLDVPIGYVGEDDIDLLNKKEELASWLISNEPVPLEFDDEPGRTYYAVVNNTILDFEEFLSIRKGVISFIIPDSYKYGLEKTATFPSDAVTLTNNGTAEADPVFEFEVTEPVTFAMVQNQLDEYQMIGRPADVNEQVVDTKVLMLEETGSTLNMWNTSPITIDDFGVVSGQMTNDGSGIIASSYGTGNTYTGPGVIREISPIQDFELVTNIDTRTDLKAETFRIELYMFDEGMNMLGKIGVLDSNTNFHRRVGLGRVGEYGGLGVRYPIYSGNYSHDNFGKSSLFNLRVKRIHNSFEFYIAQIVNGKHRNRLLNRYIDNTSSYLGRLKYIQLYISRHGRHPSPYLARFNNIRVYRLDQVTVNQTPYIAYPGDVITFDHKEDELLINGEDRKDLKNFGGQYFKLQKGTNQLVVYPENCFNTKIRYRERFR